ncbi:unnamed protein product [Sphenostylis stenocarpa]|uniref:Uncharacterized protein n=1 Tax=Sphenostylis stenocarpa TaxID=92480 RepID=A0AA86S8V2_9FABA|nr:unnamed protein product [Sphenostylis stenocarpa]
MHANHAVRTSESQRPDLAISHDKASLLAIQVNMFPNAGFCIGINAHHAAFDGKSATMFMKSWVSICSNLQNPTTPTPTPTPIPSLPHHLAPFYDRSLIKEPTGNAEVYVDTWMNHNGSTNRSLKPWDVVTAKLSDELKGLFELTPSQILKLKQHANSKVKVNVHPSTFSVTCAHVLACLVKVKQVKKDNVGFIFYIDCRSRLDPPTPATYVGNCVAKQMVVALTKELIGNDGFICALEGISEALNGMKDEGVLNEAERWVSDVNELMEGTMSITGSPRHGQHFGWGRPKKVDMTLIDETGTITLNESRDISGGIEIGLVLSKREMQDFTTLFVQGLDSL